MITNNEVSFEVLDIAELDDSALDGIVGGSSTGVLVPSTC